VIGQEEMASRCTLGRLRLDTGKNLFPENVINNCIRLPREVVESPSPDIFKRCVDVAHKDMV